MNEISRMLITVGVVCLLMGGVFYIFGKIPGLGKLPGDIIIKKENINFYFPITTCLLVSLILSLIFVIFNKR